MQAATRGGAKLFENKYGLDFCLRVSTISFEADTNPPEAPPKAFPNVDVIISISFNTSW